MCVSLPRPLSLEQPHLRGRRLEGVGTLSVTDSEARHTGPLALDVCCHVNRLLGCVGLQRTEARVAPASWGGTVTRELRSPLLPQFPWRTLPERDSVSWWCPSRPFRPTCQLGSPVRAVQGSEGLMSMALTFRAGALASVASDPSRWPHKQPSGRPMAAAAIPGLPLGFGSL